MKNVTKILQVLMVSLLLVFAFQSKAQVTMFTEGWESAAVGTTPPAGWAVDQLGYGNWMSWAASGSYPAATPYEGVRMTIFDSWNASYNYQNRLRKTVAVSTVGYSSITVDFAEYNQTTFTGGDGITIQWSTDGSTWTSAGTNWSNYGATAGWIIHTQALPVGAANQATLYIAFLFTSQYGYQVYLDLAHIKGLQTGNLTGTVRNCYTNAVMANVPVSCGGVGPVLTSAGGVYTLNGISTGPQTITANFAGFVNYSNPVTVVGNTTTTFNFCMNPIPAVLTGHVTNAANAAPINGAKIVVNGNIGYSVAGGLYSLNIMPGGTYPATFTKVGYSDSTTAPIVLTAGVTTTRDIALLEAKNTPNQPFTAALNTSSTAVNLSWGVPVGRYELIYDDGQQEISTVWAVKDNQNAEKFTPLAYPVNVVGGSVNIGPAADYASGTLPTALAPFTIQVYNATALGTPGTALGSAVTVTPTTFGWNAFTIPDVNITSGNFFLVMTQGGAPPTAARLGVDTTASQLRAFSKFVSGGGLWLPASGNFMIRAIVSGVGGPTDVPENLTGYQVYRLLEGQTGTPGLWTSIATPTAPNTVDASWPSLPDSAFQWAVKAKYTGNRWSDYIFSNVLGKNRLAAVTVNVTLTCAASAMAGTQVKLTNSGAGLNYVYTALTDATGKAVFPAVWKGVYTLQVSKMGYATTTTLNNSIYSDKTINVNLLGDKMAPTNMLVDDASLVAIWNKPSGISIPLNEKWDGGFTLNNWTSVSWTINAAIGNPAPAAELYWYPELFNYNVSLTSKTMTGTGSADFKLMYDIGLSDYSSNGAEQLDVELQIGAGAWTSIKHYANTGQIAWTTETIDIASVGTSTFKIRFRAHGADTFDINNWDIDNVMIKSTAPDPSLCILGYNVYLNGTLDGVTADTTYQIPPGHVMYGTAYTACVKAVYGSGYSAQSCDDFISKFLCPPTALTGTAAESTAYLTWVKPQCGSGSMITYQYEDGTFQNGTSINPGFNIKMGNYFPLTPTTSGLLKSFDINFTSTALSSAQSCILYIYDAAYNLIGTSAPFINAGATYPSATWMNVPVADIPFTGPFYAMIDYTIAATPVKNYLTYNNLIPQVIPSGLAWAQYNGAFASAVSTFGYVAPVTFLQRATAFVYGKKKSGELTTLDPAQIPVNQITTPVINGVTNLGADVNVTTSGEPNPTDAPSALTLLGYNVYRDGVLAPNGYINNPNTLEFYDYNLNPGVYQYTVKGYYDVSPVPPGHDNSLAAGPVEVVINYGRPLPFYEPWDLGTFTYNNWDNHGNWSVNSGFGNPAPTADYSWQPAKTNYNDTLTTLTLTAAPYTCARIYLDFDYKLLDRNQTGKEYLTVEEFVSGSWKKVVEYANNGDVNWTSTHFELKSTIGKAFKVRFRANGAKSLDILHWYVDNINVYAVCTPPTALAYTESHNTVNLTWTAPNCVTAVPFTIIWDDGTYEDGISPPSGIPDIFTGNMFPLAAGSSGYLTSFDVMFWNNGAAGATTATFAVFDAGYNLLGTSAPFTQLDGVWMNIEVPSVPFSGTFYGMVHMINSGVRPLFEAYDENGPHAADDYAMLYDNATWATVSSYGIPPGVFLNRANGFMNGKDKKSFSIMPGENPMSTRGNKHVVPELSAGTVASQDTHNHPGVGMLFPNNGSSASLQGYNVWRTDSTGLIPYYKLNNSPLSATAYTNILPLTGIGTYKYFVTAVYNDTVPNTFLCESPGSDTVTVLFPHVGITEIGNGQIMIYPNPATELVNIKSDYTITGVDVMNYVGQTVYTSSNVDSKTAKLNVSAYKVGVYFVKVSTTEGIRTVKITVTH